MIEEPDSSEVRAVEERALDRGEDGSGFGICDTVVHAEMVRQTGSEVRDGKDGLMGTELAEEEVERHCLVGDGGLDGWGGKGLHLDGIRAMADADGHIRRGSGGAVLSGGWGSHGGGVGKSLIGECHVKAETVTVTETNSSKKGAIVSDGKSELK